MRFERPTPSDRRVDDGLTFDPAEGLLELGALSVVLPQGCGNSAVLAAYVDLAGKCRGDRLSTLVEVRQTDVDALANSLDLDALDLIDEIEAILGASREEATRLVTRLKEYRLIGGIAAAASTGAIAVAMVVGGAGAGGATPAARPPAHVAAPAPSHHAAAAPDAANEPGGPVDETANGVGLIPPMAQDANGVGLIPPAQADQAADGVGLVPPASIDRAPGS